VQSKLYIAVTPNTAVSSSIPNGPRTYSLVTNISPKRATSQAICKEPAGLEKNKIASQAGSHAVPASSHATPANKPQPKQKLFMAATHGVVS